MLRNRIRSLFQRNTPPSPRRAQSSGSYEDALAIDTPEVRDVVFSPLLPVASAGAVAHFEDMSEEWLKEQVGEQVFELGVWTQESSLVRKVEVQGFYLRGEVGSSVANSQRLYLVELSLMDGQLQGACSCSSQFERIMAQGVLPYLGVAFPPCKHISASLIAYIRNRTPQNTVERMKNSCVCPVTRQSLKAGTQIFLCSQCGTAYSPEGWEFLVEVDRGKCCNCHNQNSVQSFTLPK
jgi:hypothetical protein